MVSSHHFLTFQSCFSQLHLPKNPKLRHDVTFPYLPPSLSTGLLPPSCCCCCQLHSINLIGNAVVPLWFILLGINELCFKPRELLVKIRYNFI